MSPEAEAARAVADAQLKRLRELPPDELRGMAQLLSVVTEYSRASQRTKAGLWRLVGWLRFEARALEAERAEKDQA